MKLSLKNGLIVLITIFTLMGCAYPQGKLTQNQIPYTDQIRTVQSAIERFQEENDGILPIKTKENDTPIYEKYLIDFNRITPNYIAEPPGNAFESGGVFQYVLVNVEDNPTVKIFDLRIAETLREINLRISMQKYPPYKEQLSPNVFTLDYGKLGFKDEPTVTSPFTNQELPFVVTGDGNVYVDYRKDLFALLQKGEYELHSGEDIRQILYSDSDFVPAYSLPYTIDPDTHEPIFMNH